MNDFIGFINDKETKRVGKKGCFGCIGCLGIILLLSLIGAVAGSIANNNNGQAALISSDTIYVNEKHKILLTDSGICVTDPGVVSIYSMNVIFNKALHKTDSLYTDTTFYTNFPLKVGCTYVDTRERLPKVWKDSDGNDIEVKNCIDRFIFSMADYNVGYKYDTCYIDKSNVEVFNALCKSLIKE